MTSAELRDGRRLELEIVRSGDPSLPDDERRAIATFVVDPLRPWFSAAEQEFLGFVLRGEAASSLRDAWVLGRLDGRIVGTSWHGVSATHPVVAVVAYVRTQPELRGLGIASAVTAASVRRAWADGAEVAYLGTTNPSARRIYESIGFRGWNGVAMRADRGDVTAALDPTGPLTIRDAEPGDAGGWTHLLVSTDELPWRIRSWSEDVAFAPPATPITSCVRPFSSTFMRWRTTAVGSVRVLADRRGLLGGAASVLDLGRGPTTGIGTLELLAHRDHLAGIAGLLRDVVDHASAVGFRSIVAHSDSDARTELLREAGLERDHVLRDAVVLDGRPCDVAVLRGDL